MSTQVNLAEAKAKLSDLIERAVNGEDVVIARAGKPRARLVAVPQRSEPREPGRWKGRVEYGPDWEQDLTDQFEEL